VRRHAVPAAPPGCWSAASRRGDVRFARRCFAGQLGAVWRDEGEVEQPGQRAQDNDVGRHVRRGQAERDGLACTRPPTGTRPSCPRAGSSSWARGNRAEIAFDLASGPPGTPGRARHGPDADRRRRGCVSVAECGTHGRQPGGPSAPPQRFEDGLACAGVELLPRIEDVDDGWASARRRTRDRRPPSSGAPRTDRTPGGCRACYVQPTRTPPRSDPRSPRPLPARPALPAPDCVVTCRRPRSGCAVPRGAHHSGHGSAERLTRPQLMAGARDEGARRQ
jgi:hypothetical protein